VAYRTNLDAERKLRKTGAKIRSTYIVFAHKEKKRLEAEIVSLTREIADREREVSRLKGLQISRADQRVVVDHGV
jgi:protein kinase C substrate 80K-H